MVAILKKRGECKEHHFSFFVIRADLQNAFGLVTFTEHKGGYGESN